MTRGKDRWRWDLEIQNMSIFTKWEIVPLNSKCQLWMSKAIDQEEFWQGGLYKKCSS
jgi:hypothetical protein